MNVTRDEWRVTRRRLNVTGDEWQVTGRNGSTHELATFMFQFHASRITHPPRHPSPVTRHLSPSHGLQIQLS
jgi:hypothetical protein